MAIDKFINFQGSMIHYLLGGEHNEKEWIVLLHGKKFKAGDWKENGLIEKLEGEGFRIIALELPGYGQSEELKVEMDYADFLTEFLKQLDLTTVHLVGPSFSGEVSIQFSLRHPDMLNTMTLIDSINVDKYKDELHKITVPTLIVWGRKDDIAPYEFALTLKEKIPHSTLFTFEKLGHTCYFEDTTTFANILLGFLS